MKKIFSSALLLLTAASAFGASSLPPVPFPIPGNLGGTGDTIYINPIMSSQAAAAINTALIQNALNAGGEVKLQCPAASPVFYTNAHVTIYSNTHLTLGKNCVWTQASGTNDNMLVSRAYNAAWTTLWNGTGTAAGGPFSLISRPAIWAATTSYANGATISSGTSIYWQTAAGCTSGSTGPSGTGSGISDGTCSWSYVTALSVNMVSSQRENTAYYMTVHLPSHGLVAGQFLWVNPQPDNSSSNGWTGTGSAGQRGGLADSAYFGVFPVVDVNDANYMTIKLRRQPAANFSGIPLWAKAADQNISIDGGGTLNYNTANNSSAATTQQMNSIILAGIYNLKVSDLVGINSTKYFLDIAGVSTADVGHVMGGPQWTTTTANGDQIKVYGPAFDVVVHDSGGTGWDDTLSFQPQEPSTHYDQVISSGDIVNVTARNIRGYGSFAVSMWQTHAYLRTQGVLLDNIDVSNNTFGMQPIRFGNGGQTIGNMYDVTIQHCKNSNNGQPLVGMYPGNGFMIDTLRFRDNDVESAGNGGFIGITVGASTNATINHLIMDGDRYVSTSTGGGLGSFFIMNYSTGGSFTLGDVQISNAYFSSLNAHGGYVFTTGVTTTGITIGSVSIDHSYISNFNNVFATNIAGKYSITSSTISQTTAVFKSTGASTFRYSNNQQDYGYVVDYESGSAGATLYGGGNVLSGTAAWFLYNVAANTTVYGSDVQCDVTKMNRVTGSYCFNTNAAPGSGTLTTSGPVMDQGTASGSWFLQANPTGQTY